MEEFCVEGIIWVEEGNLLVMRMDIYNFFEKFGIFGIRSFFLRKGFLVWFIFIFGGVSELG